jgi:hypothetical protein
MSKTMCQTDDKDKRAEKMKDAKFSCKKCGAKAEKKKHLCKPQKLGEIQEI